MDLNKVTLLGRTTQDVELKYTPNGKEVARVSIATNKTFTDNAGNKQEKVQFHNIVIWGNLAKIAEQYLTKGSRVLFEGELNTRSREAQDGSKRYATDIIASNMIMLGTKKQDGEGTEAPKNKNKATETKPVKSKNDTIDDISIEDIPF